MDGDHTGGYCRGLAKILRGPPGGIAGILDGRAGKLGVLAADEASPVEPQSPEVATS